MARTYAVIGDPIDHSLSPAMHNAAFRSLGMDCTYIAYRVRRGELAGGLDSLRAVGVAGFNVTAPHKVGIMELLDSADGVCSELGACNTVALRGGRLEGHNTDMDGFMDPLRERGARIKGARALLLGAGGAARAVASGLARAGAARIDVANRSRASAERVAVLAAAHGAESSAFALAEAPELAARADIIVNATTLGMRGEEPPVPAGSLRAGAIVYDIVYRPMRTRLLADARARGATAVPGYEMLVAQAARSFEIWHGARAPREEMARAVLGAVPPR